IHLKKSSTCHLFLYRAASDGQGRKAEVIGQKHQRLARLGVLESDASQAFWIMCAGVMAFESDGLVADDPGRTIRRRGRDSASVHVRLGPRHEERPGPMDGVKAGEVHVAAIHDVNGAGFGKLQVERMDVVQLTVRYLDEARNIA